MRYNVTFNQLELMAYNDKHPEKKIDFKDAIILQQFWHLSDWGEVEKIKLKDGEYFWIAYGKLNAELPALGFKTNETLSKRIKAKLLENGLLKLHVKWKDNSKTYWQFTEAGLKIAEPGKDPSRSHGGTGGGRMAEREGVAQPNGRGSHGGTDNYNTSDSFTKDEREARALEFLKKKNEFIYNQFENEYKEQIVDWEKFCLQYDDTVVKEEIKYDGKILIARLRIFARNWIERERNKRNSNEVQPVQLGAPKNFKPNEAVKK